MAKLDEYKRKRDFNRTPEPHAAGVRRRKGDRSFFMQKHDARRLHFDLRLELGGFLLSWAVTKGPSLNPADKRLAVRTEDHPLSYGTFEGTIPKGQYGGGTVMVWDTGTWEPKGEPGAGLAKGHLSFVLHGERLKGEWDLIRMRGGEKRESWLLVKKDDEEARRDDGMAKYSSSVKSGRSMEAIASGDARPSRDSSHAGAAGETKRLTERYPAVQLATLAGQPPEGREWVHEIKFDGYRLLGFVSGATARLRTRNGNDWTDRIRPVAAALEKLKANDAVLDMEATVVDSNGVSSFQALQGALGRGGNSDDVVAFVFDLLHLDGQDLRELPLTERKRKLRTLLGKTKRESVLHYSDHIVGKGGEVLAQACATHLEGIVSKKSNSPYMAGRQKTWLKIKCTQRQEFIILGFSAARSGGRAIGALYLGYHQDGLLRYAGKVGTGFTMKGARDLAARFAKLTAKKPALEREMTGLPEGEWQDIRWVEPILLCEVAFKEWTRDGRIRHPSFQGLREDKDFRDVVKETPVRKSAPSRKTAAKKEAGPLMVEGIKITHPDRIISETGHITKGELAEYYADAAPFLLPGIIRRPLSLLRCPSGIDGNCFYQRAPGKGLGPEVHPFQFKHKGKNHEYLYISDEDGLLKLVQMGVIEIHPWGAPIDAIDYPDRLIFDLDPDPGVPFEALKLAAQDLRERLRRKGLESTLKCTGGKGLHVRVPLAGNDKWPVVKKFAASVAREMVAEVPSAYVATMSKAKRRGKIFVDYFRNDYTATAIADFSVRARPGAPVAVPLDWKELKRLKSADQFTIKDVRKRLKRGKAASGSAPNGQTISSS